MEKTEIGRARPPGGPRSALPQRIVLNHVAPKGVPTGALFFVTGCCVERGRNQLCHAEVAAALFKAVRFYESRCDWHVRLWLLMPDDFHALVAPARDIQLARLLGDWKRFTANETGVNWQKNFFDHRLRSDESEDEKAHYIRMNPVRARLISEGDTWPYLLEN